MRELYAELKGPVGLFQCCGILNLVLPDVDTNGY